MEITDIPGLLCNGIKEKYGLGIVKCSGTVAGVFTKNQFKAAPVLVCEDNIRDGVIEGIIVNSGNANAFTGEEGLKDAKEMCRIAAKLMNCDERKVAVASTGVIGRKLDIEWIRRKAPIVYSGLGNTKQHAEKFAKSILTTDRFIKKSYSNKAKISAVAKGAGMIAPNMATMLCFIFTPAKFDSGELYEMLKEAVNSTFNMLSVDGDTSTNDTVLIVATGREKIDPELFQDELEKVCYNIAKQIARDGEGATKVFEVIVSGAKSKSDAIKAAKTVASSLLVKTALFGNDPNWGRIIAALGYSGAEVNDKLTISIESFEKEVVLVEDGKATSKEDEARSIMEFTDELKLKIDLKMGNYEAKAIGCDLSYDYVKLNSEYTT